MKRRRILRLAAAALSSGLLPGCAHIGPSTVSEDRLAYSVAVGQTTEEQLLLNVVRLRYVEAPVFLDVSQIVAGYEIGRELSVASELHPRNLSDNFLGFGVNGHYTDRPTITYAPVVGERFAETVMEPVPLHVVLSLIQSGWRADSLFRLLVRSFNNSRNRLPRFGDTTPPDPEFERIATLLRRLQDSGAVELRVRGKADERRVFLVLGSPRHPSDAEDLEAVRQNLGIGPDQAEIPIRAGLSAAAGEISIATFSLMQLLISQAEHAQVPADDLALGLAIPEMAEARRSEVQMAVRSGKERPPHAFAAVPYRGHWFWIDGADTLSKRVLMALAIIYRLVESSSPGHAPVLTIPAG